MMKLPRFVQKTKSWLSENVHAPSKEFLFSLVNSGKKAAAFMLLTTVILVIILLAALDASDAIDIFSRNADINDPTDAPTKTFAPTSSPTQRPTSACNADYRKPNIVTVLTDDQGYGERNKYNGHILSMPNYERIAAKGIDFTNGHSHSGVCSPSRFSLLSGRYFFRDFPGRGAFGANRADAPFKDPNLQSIPKVLATVGYKSYMSGKWHIGMDIPDGILDGELDLEIAGGPIDAGFDRFFGIPASMNYGYLSYIEDKRFTETPNMYTDKGRGGSNGVQSCPATKNNPCVTYGLSTCDNEGQCDPVSGYRYKDQRKTWGISVANSFDPHYCMSNFTDRALGFIDTHMEEYGTEVPFYLHVTLNSPHLPHVPHPDFTGENSLVEYGKYADFLEETDYRVGQLLDKLVEHDIEDNTLFILSSDNGPEGKGKFVASGLDSTNGLNGQKRNLYEGANRVPFILQWPEVAPAGTTFSHPVSQVDYLATFAEITGAVVPENQATDSFSFWKAICDPINTDLPDIRDYQPMMNESPGQNDGLGIRCGDYKLMNGRNTLELYNLKEDLNEKNNIKNSQSKLFDKLKNLMNIVSNNGFSNETKCNVYLDEYFN